MNFNRKYATIATVTSLLMVGAGAFLFSNSGATAPENPATAQSITATARDTSGAALSGVPVELMGPGNAKVTSGTTTAAGQVSLTFDPNPGTYVLTASEPSGYRARDDKDGGASNNSGLTCNNVYLCIYLTATEMQNADGSTFMNVELSHVRPEQVSELDDLWFELSPPPAVVEEETSLVDPTEDDEILIGEAGDDELIGGSDDVLIGESAGESDGESDGASDGDDFVFGGSTEDDVLIGDPVDEDILIGDPLGDDVVVEPVGLGRLCANTKHEPVVEQRAASGIWVRGEVYGLDGGWIWVEGETINNGDPLQIPIVDGRFEGPLGINSYGDHTIDRLELQGSGADDVPVDVLPTLLNGPGATFPVGPDDGSIFDDECFDFDPPAAAPPADVEAATDAATDPTTDPTPEEAFDQVMQSATTRVDLFLDGFVADHVSMNTEGLLDTLHPAVPLAFGDDRCTTYVAETAGSIVGATVIDIESPRSIDMETPTGTITFPEAIPFTVEFELMNGATVVNEATLAQHDGESRWLTRCGSDG